MEAGFTDAQASAIVSGSESLRTEIAGSRRRLDRVEAMFPGES